MSQASWDQRWMDLARLIATWSKDRSRKVGAVIVDSRNVVVSLGWNGFPRGVDDDVESRHKRPRKYQFVCHAEIGALANSAAKGVPTVGCTIYLPWYPCADCAKAIIQAGIAEVVGIEPDWSDPKYADDFAVTATMFAEAGVAVRFVAGEAPVQQ